MSAGPSNPTCGYVPQRTGSSVCCRGHCGGIPDTQEVETAPRHCHRRMGKQTVVCTCKGVLLRHKEESRTQAMTRVSPEDIMPSEISQSQKDTRWISLLLEVSGVTKFTETQNRRAGARGWGKGRGQRRIRVYRRQNFSWKWTVLIVARPRE